MKDLILAEDAQRILRMFQNFLETSKELWYNFLPCAFSDPRIGGCKEAQIFKVALLIMCLEVLK